MDIYVASHIVERIREWTSLDSTETRDSNGITGVDLEIVFKLSKDHAAKYLSDSFGPQWTSVEEKLPRDDGQYLVACPDGVRIATMNNDSECWDDEFGDDYWRDLVGYVTHWMPLPEPPDAKA